MGGNRLTASQVKKDIQDLKRVHNSLGKVSGRLEHTINSLQGKIDTGVIPNIETRGRKPNEEKLEKFRTLFSEGKTVTEVAKTMGCATSYASQLKSEFGL